MKEEVVLRTQIKNIVEKVKVIRSQQSGLDIEGKKILERDAQKLLREGKGLAKKLKSLENKRKENEVVKKEETKPLVSAKDQIKSFGNKDDLYIK